MRVKERILTIRLLEISKLNPAVLNAIGVLVKPSIKSTICEKQLDDNIENGVSPEN